MNPADVGPLSIVVVGASGDLARRKIFPALFSLYCQNLLPPGFAVVGFARTPMTDAEFRGRIGETLTCRYTPDHACGERMAEFLGACRYVAGEYGSVDSFLTLFQALRQSEPAGPANRLFYLAVPPSVFLDVAWSLGNSGLIPCGASKPWARVVVEKPFGRDRPSSDRLADEMGKVFTERQTFRIDHYLGKEVVQNLLVLRFANDLFEPLWNRRHIRAVNIRLKEDIGLEDRAGYFDAFGIVRDVMQNHLLQILSLLAMEPPDGRGADAVRDGKVRVLRAVRPATRAHVVIGQYAAGSCRGEPRRGYREERGVPAGSRTPTFAACVLRVDTPRWQGVPFVLSAGKGLDERLTEVQVLFDGARPDALAAGWGKSIPNCLTLRIQPDEDIRLRINTKVPGLDFEMAAKELDLRYRSAFEKTIPDAYEALLLDVLQNERTLFIRKDELDAAWDIFTPLLHDLERDPAEPEFYAFGSPGPSTARLAATEDRSERTKT